MNKISFKTKAVLFDLDGTLLDTASDLGKALNAILQEEGIPPQPANIIRQHAGHGCKGLLKLAINNSTISINYPDFCERFFNHYEKFMLQKTCLFHGMDDTLKYLENNNITWGIVTNKPKRFTDPLLKHLNLNKRSKCIISGDTLKVRKPSPEPLLYACELLKTPPEKTIYIGDMETDVIASRAAGIKPITALFGYITPDENPYSWKSTAYLKTPKDLIDWILTPADSIS